MQSGCCTAGATVSSLMVWFAIGSSSNVGFVIGVVVLGDGPSLGVCSGSHGGVAEILKRVGPVTYQLDLPPELGRIHNVFHVSMLRRYRLDPSHIVLVEKIEVRPDLTFENEPVQILDRDVKVLRRKSILLVKVLWPDHGTKEAT
ncbi:uncharacterized protein [Gossypium hirsutum]|uniref:Tf2-1-like SH3-like domain-containing protein n=1 Tax=Gossypium hirsutum TaxID=3635 RepID=A0A1U8PR01_GOSHI|nr:uncharacterized protein LOC107961038 [Gossypium hirsutum]